MPLRVFIDLDITPTQRDVGNGALTSEVETGIAADPPPFVDGSLQALTGFCREHQIPVHLLGGSDGIIHHMFAMPGIRKASDCGATECMSGGALILESPHCGAGCTECTWCRRNIMLSRSADDEVIVYAGEGDSGRCPAQYADIVFAKDRLQTFCQEKNISYHLYNSFQDIVHRLQLSLGRKRLRKRLVAEHMRRAAYIAE